MILWVWEDVACVVGPVAPVLLLVVLLGVSLVLIRLVLGLSLMSCVVVVLGGPISLFLPVLIWLLILMIALVRLLNAICTSVPALGAVRVTVLITIARRVVSLVEAFVWHVMVARRRRLLAILVVLLHHLVVLVMLPLHVGVSLAQVIRGALITRNA